MKSKQLLIIKFNAKYKIHEFIEHYSIGIPLITFREATNLLLSDVNRLVNNDPRNSLVAGGSSRGALVCHIIVRVRQQTSDRQTVDWHLGP